MTSRGGHVLAPQPIIPATESGQVPCGNLKRPSGLTLIYYGSLVPMMYQVRS